jgi:hypothetical protein
MGHLVCTATVSPHWQTVAQLVLLQARKVSQARQLLPVSWLHSPQLLIQAPMQKFPLPQQVLLRRLAWVLSLIVVLVLVRVVWASVTMHVAVLTPRIH